MDRYMGFRIALLTCFYYAARRVMDDGASFKWERREESHKEGI